MSCLHKRPKRSEEEERAFQEHVKKVAQENGKRLGKSSPPLNVYMRLAFGFPRSNTITRLCVKVSQSLQRPSVGGMFVFHGSLLAWSYGFLPGTYRF